ncbi:MAG TPA: tetratricopeptide repeat protein, partial [Candidatus Eisenbacteria bacterium]|nr:tetratricopeptide repeat protein [Candidatus Eisenbacteria bacterium]
LNGLGGVAFYRGDLESSGRYHEEALPVQRELGDTRGTAFSLRELGEVATGRGDLGAAADRLREALTIYRDLEDRQGIASTLEGFAVLAAAHGRGERAFRLLGAAGAIREAIQTPISGPDESRMERFLAPAREALGERVAAELSEGSKLALEPAMKLAMEAI